MSCWMILNSWWISASSCITLDIGVVGDIDTSPSLLLLQLLRCDDSMSATLFSTASLESASVSHQTPESLVFKQRGSRAPSACDASSADSLGPSEERTPAATCTGKPASIRKWLGRRDIVTLHTPPVLRLRTVVNEDVTDFLSALPSTTPLEPVSAHTVPVARPSSPFTCCQKGQKDTLRTRLFPLDHLMIQVDHQS